MSIIELIFLGFAISADSFAASILIGIKENKININMLLLVATLFGFLQSLMPIFGYFLINLFSTYLVKIDHYIAFIFLIYLGINMIRNKDSEEYKGINLISLIILGIAVTIDAFAIGITYSVLNVRIILTIIINFIITFITSVIGIMIGSKIGVIIQDKTNIIGGIILIIIAFKILLSHLNII